MEDYSVVRYFPESIKKLLIKIDESCLDSVYEIRVRTNSPLIIKGKGGERYVYKNGDTGLIREKAYVCSGSEVENIFNSVCDDSVHSYARELKEGFITVSGGHRVGICGTAVITEKGLKTVKNISSINFRIAHQIKGCSDKFFYEYIKKFPCGILVAGAPGSGKTTFIRDLCRNLSGEFRISIIDERSEIAAVYMGKPQNDLGDRCDVFNGYPKKEGIETALRVMSPRIIVCDEIGTKKDVNAIKNLSNAGVEIIATAHAGNKIELYKRRNIMKLVNSGIFRIIIFLDNGPKTGNVQEIIVYGEHDNAD